MSKINTEYYLAQRISSRAGGRKNVMVRIATATVAVSMAVMIISLAVISGFKSEITVKLTGFGGHVEVVNLDGNSSLETSPIARNAAFERAASQVRNFAQLYPYAVKGGIIKTGEAMQGVMLKGVDGSYDWKFFAENLTQGRLPEICDTARTKDIILSESLAGTMKLGVDDRVEMLFLQQERPPRRDRFKITGIYKTGLEEMDRMVVLTDIRNVQRLNGWSDDRITGYEINTTDFSRLGSFAEDIEASLRAAELADGEYLMAVSIQERFPNLFDWLKAHNVNAAVILTIMIMVSLLNMISALLIILLERTKMIGILKSLGMSNRALQKMFVTSSAFIVAKGLLWGNILGIGLCLLQRYTGFLKLDEAGYFLSVVPVELGAGWIAGLNAATFLLLVLALSFPTRIVSRIRPDKTMRYQ